MMITKPVHYKHYYIENCGYLRGFVDDSWKVTLAKIQLPTTTGTVNTLQTVAYNASGYKSITCVSWRKIKLKHNTNWSLIYVATYVSSVWLRRHVMIEYLMSIKRKVISTKLLLTSPHSPAIIYIHWKARTPYLPIVQKALSQTLQL